MLMLIELEGFEDEFHKIVNCVAQTPVANYELESQQIATEERALQRERQNYLDAIAMYGPNAEIGKRLEELKVKFNDLTLRKAALHRKSVRQSDVPTSANELMQMLKEEFLSLAIDSYEFGAMLPKIVPQVFVYCVRMCDGGSLLPRAKFTVDLSGSFESDPPDLLQRILRREFTVDVFDSPKHNRIRPQVVELANLGMTNKQIAAALNEPVSGRMISKAIKLDKYMRAEQIADPYSLQLEPPSDLKKMRRHLHPRYEFSLSEGYCRSDF